MASYLPPTEELPIFDNQVFDIANNTALTYSDARKYFVSYPIAQGTSTISDLIAGTISYLSPLSGSFFDIGTNQVSGGTIRIGPTGGTAGVSVHCANLDFKNNGMNNATSNSGGDVSICNSQTSGVLNIGTGVRTTTGNGGTINIGNNASSSNIAPISIGCATNTTTINGLLNATLGLTIGNALTLPTTTTSPTSLQLGYIGRAYNNALVNYSSTGVGSDIVSTGAVLPIGIYQMQWTVNVNNWTNGTTAYMNFSFNTSSGITMYGVPQATGATPPTSGSDYIMQLQGVTNSATIFATFDFSCIVKATSANSEINFRGRMNTGTNTATSPIGYCQVTWIRIA